MGTAIRNRVKELRAVTFRGEVSQKELAERAGIDPSTVSDIENQKAQPSIETALALARALGCNVEDLFLPSDIADAAMDTSAAESENGSAAPTRSSSGPVTGESRADRNPAGPRAAHSPDEPTGEAA